MMTSFFTIIKYEIQITLRQAHAWLTPLFFFVMIVCLFPFALGSDKNLLRTAAPAIIWIAAMLAILLSLRELFQSDAETRYLDHLSLSEHSLTSLVILKMLSHWILYCLPLILISPLLGLVLNLTTYEEMALILTLLLGTPVLILIGGIGAALLVGIRHSGVLLPVLIMPLYIPVLIFGTGTLAAASSMQPLSGYLAMLAALNLISIAFAPLLTSLALRIGVHH
jgi:heme exporter protein B